MVNKFIDIDNGILYVVSMLRGDDEKLSDFNRYVAIDMYSSNEGEYKGSISIPKINKSELQDFKVSKDRIVAIYKDGTCAVFKIDE